MSEKTFRVAAGSNVSTAELQGLVAIVVKSIQPGGAQNTEYEAWRVAHLDAGLPEAADVQVEVRQAEQNFDPAAGLLVAAGWLGGKVLEKVGDLTFDLFWDRFIQPRIDIKFGLDAVKREREQAGHGPK